MSLQLKKMELWSAHDFKRFEASVGYGDEDECWAWNGPTNGKASGNYPVFNFSHEGNQHLVMPAHVLYDRIVETLPRNKRVQLRTTCGDRRCVNPHHRKISAKGKKGKKRGPRKRAKQGKKDICDRGHDLTRAGARYTNNGISRCAECKREYTRDYNKRIAKKRRAERQERQKNWAKYAEERLKQF